MSLPSNELGRAVRQKNPTFCEGIVTGFQACACMFGPSTLNAPYA